MTFGELLAEAPPEPSTTNFDDVNFMSVEYDSLPQDAIPRIRGSPEGVLAERIGYIIVDFETGKLWKKNTTSLFSTGWVELVEGVASAGNAIKTGPYENPNGNVTPDDPNSAAIYYQEGGDGVLWNWQPGLQIWT